MLALFGALMTLVVAMFAYMTWDRRTMIKPIIDRVNLLEHDIVNDLELYNISGSLVQRQLNALRRYADTNLEFAEDMHKYNLMRGAMPS